MSAFFINVKIFRETSVINWCLTNLSIREVAFLRGLCVCVCVCVCVCFTHFESIFPSKILFPTVKRK